MYVGDPFEVIRCSGFKLIGRNTPTLNDEKMKKNNRTEIIALRCTEEEKQLIFTNAHKCFKTMSSYIRDKAIDE